jgi:rhodanese-related sulfurtransferase
MQAAAGALVRECGVVLLVGGLLALAANGVSPRGLSLTRDYFPALGGLTSAPAPAPAPGASVDATPAAGRVDGVAPAGSPAGGAEAAAARLQANGLVSVGDDEVRALFDDPRYAQELVVFVDARDDRRYRAGHIPGAYRFDRFRPEETLAEVVLAGQSAERMVIYCNGGECEDSEYAAIALRDAGVPADRIAVYLGGIVAWQGRGWPVESGDRGSGVLLEGEGRR